MLRDNYVSESWKVFYEYNCDIGTINMMKKYYTIPLFFFLVLLLTACATTTQEVISPTENLELPNEKGDAPTPPPPSEGKGVVCGYLIDEATSLPPQSALFLSANIAAGRDDVPAMISFSYQNSPRAEMNEEGYFCFENVEPGTYALTLWTPPSNTEFVENVDGQDYLWIEVDSGSVVDLGHITN